MHNDVYIARAILRVQEINDMLATCPDREAHAIAVQSLQKAKKRQASELKKRAPRVYEYLKGYGIL